MIQPSCREHECIYRLIGLALVVVLAYGAAAQAEQGKPIQSQSERASAHDASRSSAVRASEGSRPVAPTALGGGHVEFVASANVVLHSEGGVAGPPPAVVFSNTIFGNGILDPEGDLGAGFFFFRVGSNGGWTADDWQLALPGDDSECSGASLQVAVYGGGFRCHDAPEFNPCTSDGNCSVGGCTPSPNFDATVDVFNHDPSFADDDLMPPVGVCITEDPGVGAFSTTFTNLDGLSANVLSIDLGRGLVGGPFGAIWARVQTTTDSSGWILGSNADTWTPAPPADDAEVGFSVEFLVANDVINANFCGLLWGDGVQLSFWGNLFCESAIAMSLQPAFATGIECPNGAADDPANCDWYIDGPNSIVLHRPGQDISSELFISGWDQTGTGLLVAAASSGLDCATFSSGKEGTFRPPIVTTCDDDFTQICNGSDESRPDYVFFGLPTITGCGALLCADGSPGFINCGAFVLTPNAGGADDGMPKYCNTYGWLDEGDNARGTFFLNITADPNATYVNDPNAEPIAPIARIPMRVVVQTGACCGSQADPFCESNLLFDECKALGGNFLPGSECLGFEGCIPGIDAVCTGTCDTNIPDDIECNDNNDCTEDECQACGCFNADITTPGFCCNPAGGAETQIEDGNDCTIDDCNPLTGQVAHMFSPDGTACDDGNPCTSNDQCDRLGMCAGTPEPCSNPGRCCHQSLGALACADGFPQLECAVLGGSFVADAICANADANGDGSDDACVLLGACCGVANAPLECVDTVSDGDCTALGGTSFAAGESCTEVDSNGFGLDDTCPGAVPAVSSWGLLILGLLLASAAKLYGFYGTPDRRPRTVIKV